MAQCLALSELWGAKGGPTGVMSSAGLALAIQERQFVRHPGSQPNVAGFQERAVHAGRLSLAASVMVPRARPFVRRSFTRFSVPPTRGFSALGEKLFIHRPHGYILSSRSPAALGNVRLLVGRWP